ncbi:MAG TPA: TylF/MycF/NovP-related O-methyltransferase [Terriglobales bacterium]|nr:TylF/MycF/NovP-related O-methyltransferase [Terriglobales bacterium]
MLLRLTKQALSKVGTLVPNAALNYLVVGRWMQDNGFQAIPRLPSKWRVFDQIASEVGEKRVLYLEFGVYKGWTMKYWSKVLRHRESHLHGFDSFEGLPEDFVKDREKGVFSTNGDLPKIDDPRVQFFKGWFEQTLPTYEPPPHDQLIVNMDADLYSSTAFVLCQIRNLLKPGTYVFFDEFNNREHELRAFDEFRHKTGMPFSPVCATRTLEGVAFRVI